jgi:hypothetical protein
MLTKVSRQEDPESVKTLELRQVRDEMMARTDNWQTEGFKSKVGSGSPAFNFQTPAAKRSESDI